MTEPSWRKPAGIFAILLLIAVWAALVAIAVDRVGRWPVLRPGDFLPCRRNSLDLAAEAAAALDGNGPVPSFRD